MVDFSLINNDFIYALVILQILVLAGLCSVYYIVSKLRKAIVLRWAKEIDWQQLLHPLIQADLALNKNIHGQHQQLLELANRCDNLERQQNSKGAYAQAAKMLDMGADPQSLIKTCQLNPAEAKLLMDVQKYKSQLTSK